MKKILLQVILLIPFTVFSQNHLKTPEEFLGFDLGERFVRHHQMISYYKEVANVMPNVKLYQYGETYEHRPLVTAIFSSQENFDKLESIRKNNLKRTGLLEGSVAEEPIAIVWLSYNVHGNESSSLDASMKTLYNLVDPANDQSREWLKNVVVIMDPCINPDGRERYVNFYSQYGNRTPNPNGDAKEHHEPWPGGRANHYLFDLNRDWAWLSQVETQQRIKLYNEWMPHIHVDYHEQYYNNPYYFAPAAEPFHEVITQWQRDFQTAIGKNHAMYFDQNNWLYFTKESYDLFYPSYGDTYPTYNGAIGMTYEQAGHGYAGLAIELDEGDTLTLADRIEHHYTTGLSTVEMASKNAKPLVNEFRKYFAEGQNNPSSKYKSYVIKSDGNIGKIKQLMAYLDKQKISHGYTNSGRNYKAFGFQMNEERVINIDKSDLVISAYQPKSRLLTSLFEPQSKLLDSVTYDITAWSLPYAYGLKAFAIKDKINIRGNNILKPESNQKPNRLPYAYLAEYNCLNDAKWLSQILKKGLKVRFAERGFSLEGKNYSPGTLILTRRYNENLEKVFDESVIQIANEHNKKVYPAYTGFVEKGKDFGSSKVHYLRPPKVAVLSGKGTSSLSFGEVWHFFERQINYPITVLDTDYFKGTKLSTYNVLVLPEGQYEIMDETLRKSLKSWVSQGGRLILLGNALKAFVDKEGFGLKKFVNEEEKKASVKRNDSIAQKETIQRYEDREKTSITSSISGAIYKVSVDNSHPLAFGYGSEYFSLKRGSDRYAYIRDGWNVGVIKDAKSKVSGFSGYKTNKKVSKTLAFGVQGIDDGEIVYFVDNPLYRAFWENGKLLFSNAVFMVGQD